MSIKFNFDIYIIINIKKYGFEYAKICYFFYLKLNNVFNKIYNASGASGVTCFISIYPYPYPFNSCNYSLSQFEFHVIDITRNRNRKKIVKY